MISTHLNIHLNVIYPYKYFSRILNNPQTKICNNPNILNYHFSCFKGRQLYMHIRELHKTLIFDAISGDKMLTAYGLYKANKKK